MSDVHLHNVIETQVGRQLTFSVSPTFFKIFAASLQLSLIRRICSLFLISGIDGPVTGIPVS